MIVLLVGEVMFIVGKEVSVIENVPLEDVFALLLFVAMVKFQLHVPKLPLEIEILKY